MLKLSVKAGKTCLYFLHKEPLFHINVLLIFLQQEIFMGILPVCPFPCHNKTLKNI